MTEEGKIRLLFAADLVPTASNEQYFIDGDVGSLFGEGLLSCMEKADFRCFNLETPLTDRREETHAYPGPYLAAKPGTVNGIAKIAPSLLTLGNNHVLDQGAEGFLQTASVLAGAGIPFTGAGKDAGEAREPFFTEVGGVRIGVFNCSEYPYAAAAENRCGANGYDPLVSFDLVRAMRDRCDFLVVLYHGGREFYRYPSPQLRRVCRKFAECGADLVICQHSHCVGCAETYEGATLVYGQGNFLMDRNEDEFKKTGLFVQVDLDPASGEAGIGYVPFVKQGAFVRLADEAQAAGILDGFRERSGEILVPGAVEARYGEFADAQFERYLAKMTGRSAGIRFLRKILGAKFYRGLYDRGAALDALNVVSSESHQELFARGLRNASEKGKRGK